jgi:pathogenesis-related protein 1
MLPARISWAIWLVAFGVANQANSQIIELQSLGVGALDGTELARFLAAHNVARRDVGVDPVEWSDELSNYARESLAQQKDSLVAQAKAEWSKGRAVLPNHRTDSKFGENIAGWVGGRGTSAELAVAFWLREKSHFDRLNAIAPYRVGDERDKVERDATGNELPIVVNHYTAIAWRSTKFIGAAKMSFGLIDDDGHLRTYVAIVCNYSPPGNRLGEVPF